MIHSIYADRAQFKKISFKQGLNVIIADQASGSDEKESRNGLGKSSLIEILHFCLGSDYSKSGTLSKPELANWTFFCEMTVGNSRVIISRSTSTPNIIAVDGKTSGWPIQPVFDEELIKQVYTNDVWKDLLGKLMFDLPIGPSRTKFGPSFRQLISYVARLGRDGYTNPFQYRSQQAAYQIQVLNAYLLDLSWEYAVEWHNLKNKEEDLRSIKKASKTGYFSDVVGSVGELEALKLRLEQRIHRESEQLSSFQVHPQYKEFETDANSITNKIHELTNHNISSSRLVEFYKKSLVEESSATKSDVEKIYNEAGVLFPERVSKRLEDVVDFHENITRNRETFLREEINKLNRSISGREDKIKELSTKRAKILQVLQTHKALEEYTMLQETLNSTKVQYEDVKRRIDLLKKFESGKSALRIEKEELLQNTRRDYDERTTAREKAITTFNECSESLYNRPGQLIINITESGYRFEIEIEREQSDGIRLMEIFCYDLALAQIWSTKPENSGFLFHDSTLFADVDERQIASALKLATKAASTNGFQYICCLNSDKVPYALLHPDLNLKNYIVSELKDKPEDACLFGFRF